MTKKEKEIVTKVKWVDNVMVRSHHKVAICTSEKDFKFELKRLHISKKEWTKWLRGGDLALTHTYDRVDKDHRHEKIVIICVRPDDQEAIFHFIHEAVHIYQQEMEYIGEKNPSDEFMAYSIEAIATNLIKGYFDRIKGTKDVR